MELTLNELKIFRNALISKLRGICMVSSEFDDINKSLQKVINEIERIENDIKQKTCDEAFKAINDILKLKEKEDTDYSLNDLIKTIEAIDYMSYTYNGSEPFIKIEVDYIMLETGELETLFAFRDKNKNCVITFK